MNKQSNGRQKRQSVAWAVAVEEYLAEVKMHRKEQTHDHYAWVLKRYFRYGDTRVGDVSPHDFTKSLDRLAHVPAMRQRAFATVRAFIRWAHRKHYCDRNPMERMREPRAYVPRARILTTDELAHVWRAARPVIARQRTARWPRLSSRAAQHPALRQPFSAMISRRK